MPVVLNHGLQPEIFVGLRSCGFAIALFRNGKWEFVAGSGAGSQLGARGMKAFRFQKGHPGEIFKEGLKTFRFQPRWQA